MQLCGATTEAPPPPSGEKGLHFVCREQINHEGPHQWVYTAERPWWKRADDGITPECC